MDSEAESRRGASSYRAPSAKGSSSAKGSRRSGSIAGSAHGTNRSSVSYHEVEIPATEFFEGVDPDVDFMTSLYAIPLKEWERSEGPKLAHEARVLDSIHAVAEAEKPGQEKVTSTSNRKYKMRHSGKTRTRLVTSLEERECLATWVTVDDLAAWTLWDSGSTTTGVTPSFAELAKVKVDTLEDPHVLQLGTVGSRSIIKYGADVLIKVAKTEAPSYVDIANFDRYDMIIGTPWMRRNKVVLDFMRNEVVVNGVAVPVIKVKGQDLDPRLRRHRATDRRKEE